MKAIYPGYFKKFHQGHMWVLKRALEIFSFVYVIVSWNHLKNNQEIKKRFYEVKEHLKNFKNVIVIINENKTIYDIADELNCYNIVRGIRNQNDYLYEEELLANNLYFNHKMKYIYFINTKPKITNSYKQFKKRKEISNE